MSVDFPHGLMFHRFRSTSDDSGWQGAITAADFEKILLSVGPENILTPQDWVERLVRYELRPHDLCLTFDDGLRSQIDIALPVLEKLGLQAFWFIYSSVFEAIPVKAEIYSYVAGQSGGMPSMIAEFLGRCSGELLAQLKSDEFMAYSRSIQKAVPFYSSADIQYRFLRNRPSNKEAFEHLMDKIVNERGFVLEEVTRQLWLENKHLKTLAEKGHSIGLHSYSHPYEMARLTLQEQKEEYQKNYNHILSVTGQKPSSVAHPLNSYNENSMDVLRKLGIRCGFRANMAPTPSGKVNASPWECAREDSANLLSTVYQEN